MQLIVSRFKISFSFVAVIVLTFAFFYFINMNKVNAAELDDVENADLNQVNLTIDSPFSETLPDGTLLFFETEDDYNKYMKYENVNARCATCNQTTQTVESSSVSYKQFVNYHPETPAWVPADKHVLQFNKTATVTGSFKYGDWTLSASVTYTHGVSSSIPADPNKLSRLGIYSDIKFTKYKNVVKNPVGTVIDTYYTSAAMAVNAPYILVVYK
ncbi:hypothetical protein [Lysinibacillus sp. RC79]|uniref:hypothetical protein n=1 Tax=Lysinibacillus sp. RC79 TaxID=3156296 RepID=UPI00351360C3